MKSVGWVVLFSLLTSCATSTVTLNENAANVRLLTGSLPASCRSLGPVTGVDRGSNFEHASRDNAYTRMLNKAAKMGANRVTVTDEKFEDFDQTFKGEAYACSNYAGFSNDEIYKGCMGQSGDACFELAFLHYQAFDIFNASLSMDLACEYKYKDACEIAPKFRAELEHIRKIAKLINQCQGGSSQSCLEVSFVLHEDKVLDDAIKYAQMACVKNKQEGCTLSNQYSQEKIAKQNQTLQAEANRQMAVSNLIHEQMAYAQASMAASQASMATTQAIGLALSAASNSSRQPAQAKPTSTHCTSKPIYFPGGEYTRTEMDCSSY